VHDPMCAIHGRQTWSVSSTWNFMWSSAVNISTHCILDANSMQWLTLSPIVAAATDTAAAADAADV